MSLNNRSVRLADLGRREEALETIEEAVRTLASFFLRLPEAFADWMRIMIQSYLARCEETGIAPDADLLEPIAEALGGINASRSTAS